MKRNTLNINKNGFFYFLFKKEQVIDWIIMFLCVAIGYTFIKYYYPYPASMSDAAAYVASAINNTFSFYRPFGYSYFLRIIHSVSSNIHSVFIIQMFLYLLGTAMLAFSVKYFFKPNNKYLWYAALLFFTISPLSFYMANSTMSDLLFTILCYLLFTSFLFIINKKSWGGLFFFAFFLYCLLHTRYSSTVFPFVFILIFFCIKNSLLKWGSIFCCILLFFAFQIQLKENMKEAMKMSTYSTGFSGWLATNSALYIVPHIDLQPEDIENKRIRNFHSYILSHKDTIISCIESYKTPTAGFMWDNGLPLKQYLFLEMQKTNKSYPHNWVALGNGLYNDYGNYIIRNYPFQFLQYYFFPNMIKMFYPLPLDMMVGFEKVSHKEYFDWYTIPEETDTSCKDPDLGVSLAHIISISHSVMWGIIVIVAIIALIFRKRIHFTREEKIAFWGLFFLGVVYYASTIYAAPVIIRYWMPMKAIQFLFCYVLLNKIFEKNLSSNIV